VSRRRLEAVWIALLVIGLALMIPFEETITLALGVACLLAFVGLGVFLIAGSLLEDDEDAPPARTTPDPPP
jgi:threonine/homoserine efflux transporter RhtA